MFAAILSSSTRKATNVKEVIKKIPSNGNSDNSKGSALPIHPLHQMDIEADDRVEKLKEFLQSVVGELIDNANIPTDFSLFAEGKVTNYQLRVWIEPGYYLEADVQLGFKRLDKKKGTSQAYGLELDCYWDYPFENEHALRTQTIFTDLPYWFEVLTAMHSVVVTNLSNCLLSELPTL